MRLYKQTPANARSQVSYYRLGTALAFCLDVGLRQAGGSLAATLRLLWERLGRHGRGYGRHDLMAAIADTSPDLAEQMPGWLDGRGVLPIEASLASLGLMLDPVLETKANAGWTLREGDGSVWIDRTVAGGAAERAGLVPGDELVALRDWRCRTLKRTQHLLDGPEQCQVTYSRRGLIGYTQLSLEKPGVDRHRLTWDPGAAREARLLRDQWFQVV